MSDSHVIEHSRRHDLDALRAFAMLAGIALHGALSFMPVPWPVQDDRQSDFFGLVFAAIHGFRMPLFFLLSGFFTAMLWRRRGMRSLLEHRFRRVFLPLLLGLVTVIPAVNWVAARAVESGIRDTLAARPADGADVNEQDPGTGLTPLSLAVIEDRTKTIHGLLLGGAEASGRNRDGSTPLAVAAVLGRTEAAEQLIRAGADTEARAGDGSTPLHTAAFFGRAGVVEALVQAGANSDAKNKFGQTPFEVMATDWGTTKYIADLLQVQVDRKEVEAGRSRAAEILSGHGEGGDRAVGPAPAGTFLTRPFFHHLWFLWFLSLLVVGFAVVASLADRRGWKGAPTRLITSPLRFLWLIPISMLPQLFTGSTTFGPDTSTSILPAPHVLALYAIFFGFGALVFDCRDDSGRVGKRWWFSLPLGLFVLFPLGIEFSTGVSGLRDVIAPPVLHRPISAGLQVAYAWVMTLGLMGLFRRLLTRANRSVRYLSDSSYWLYLTHVPLIIGAQMLVRDWPLPAFLKFTLVCGVVTALLLVTYQAAIRDRWLGKLLNGRWRSARSGSDHRREPDVHARLAGPDTVQP